MKKHNSKKDRSVGIGLIVFQLWSLYFSAAGCLAGFLWTHCGYDQWQGGMPAARSPLYEFLFHTSFWWNSRLSPFWCLLFTVLVLLFAVRLLLHLTRRIRLSSVSFSVCMLLLSSINLVCYGWLTLQLIMSI